MHQIMLEPTICNRNNDNDDKNEINNNEKMIKFRLMVYHFIASLTKSIFKNKKFMHKIRCFSVFQKSFF